MIDFEAIGSWVKIPGLSPEESGALHYLTEEQLGKLRERVDRALEAAKRKKEAMAAISPGVSVVLTRSHRGVPAYTHGYVIDRGALVGGELAPDDHVPVCCFNYGLAWVPVSLLTVN